MRRERREAGVATAAAALTLVAVSAASCGGQDVVTIRNEGRLVVRDFRFEPDRIGLRLRRATTLVIENDDGVEHNFTVPELGIDVDLAAGEQTGVDVTVERPPDRGTLRFHCQIHDFEGMSGTILVRF
jgi:plastocyanin